MILAPRDWILRGKGYVVTLTLMENAANRNLYIDQVADLALF